MEKLIWTPRLYGNCDFGIYLNRNFATEMIQSKVSAERQMRMNELANKELKRLNINWSNPYIFYENSCFISQFYIGQNGVWLSTTHQEISNVLSGRESSEPIEYNSHNVDISKQAYTLMVLFDKWIEYASVLKSD